MGHSGPIQFVFRRLYDRNPLKADMVSRPPRPERMLVILCNRGVRPCQTMKIAQRLTDACLGTKVS